MAGRPKKRLPFASISLPVPPDPLVGTILSGVVRPSAMQKARISDKDWKRIEEAYCRPIPSAARQEILAVTQAFLTDAPFEIAAPHAAPALVSFDALQSAARHLASALQLYRDPHIDGVLEQHLAYPGMAEAAYPIADLTTRVMCLVLACKKAREMIEAEPGYKVGEAWDAWVRRLTRVCKAHGLPTGASKARRRTMPGDINEFVISPFVAFVTEMQSCVPAEFRRSDLAADGLTKAVSQARGRTTRT